LIEILVYETPSKGVGSVHHAPFGTCLPYCFCPSSGGNFIRSSIETLSESDSLSSEFGKDVAGGIVRAAKKWGRLEQDLKSGLLWFPYWGLPVHKESRAQVYWGYGTILGDRDINEHCFDWLKLIKKSRLNLIVWRDSVPGPGPFPFVPPGFLQFRYNV